MEKKKVKIVQISTGGDGRNIWITGLGSDNKAYVWDYNKGEWVLHANKVSNKL